MFDFCGFCCFPEMDLFRSSLIIAGILCLLVVFGYGSIIHISEEHYNKTRPSSVGQQEFIQCNCTDGTRTAKIKENGLEKMFNKIQNKTFCRDDKKQVCKWLKECKTCFAAKENCTADPKSGGVYRCTKKVFEMRNSFIIKTMPNNASSVITRRKRQMLNPACTYPLGMKKSTLQILKYPSSVQVKQTCIFGHTLPEGISREMRCVYAEDKWKPKGFEDCLPFIDCTMHLISPGSLNCTSGTIDKAPMCNISCGHYEDKAPVPEATYECLIYGGWKPKPPYCAVAGTGLQLVPAPRIKFHSVDESGNKVQPRPTKKSRAGPRKTP